MTCSRYDVVVVPFPFTDRQSSKRRPALALSAESFNAEIGHTLLAMITSADNPPWPLDIRIDARSAGLPHASKIRMKIFTLDNRLILRRLGTLNRADRVSVADAIRKLVIS